MSQQANKGTAPVTLPVMWGGAGEPEAADLLYLHPTGHHDDLVVPMGALACVNAAPGTKLGRYAFEVRDEEIARARVVAIDLHWSVGMPGFEALLAHVRRVSPRVPVVVGGITAGFYARELLQRLSVDYVVRGHAETSFARLVGALLDETDPAGIPGVCTAAEPDSRARVATQAELDAVDCITADWFPTYDRCSGWDAEAFPPGRTIPVARGCPWRCPECYGSFAASFGGGVVTRSPEAVARDLARAAAAGLGNLRFFVGKPSRAQLAALIAALSARGPFRLPSAVGFYLCRAPTEEGLQELDETFENPVSLSVIPPAEHVPRIHRLRIADEQRAWQRAAAFVARSRHLELDIWSMHTKDLDGVRRELVDTPGGRVKVSSAASWRLTRPTDAGKERYDHVRDAVDPLWTFYAARALSPALAALLRPFGFLDEIAADPERQGEFDRALQPFHDAMMNSWREHALPVWPRLQLSLLSCALCAGAEPFRQLGDIRTTGILRAVRPGEVERLGEGDHIDLSCARNHRGVELGASLDGALLSSLPRGLLAFVPQPLSPVGWSGEWLEALGAHGLVAVDLSAVGEALDTAGAFAAELSLRARVHLQGVSVALLHGDPNGSGNAAPRAIAEGRADLGYFRA